jgi:ABC-type multidrug transport system permease subunit
VIFVKDLLYAVLAIISAVVAIYFFYSFQAEGNSTSLIIGIVFALLALVLGGFFMFGKVNRHEDIHITE